MKSKSSLHHWVDQRALGHLPGGASRMHLGSVPRQLYTELQCVRMWNPTDTTNHQCHGSIFNFDFTQDGSVLVAACEENDLLMFDPHNEKLIGCKEAAHNDSVNCVRFLDTRMFATCSDDHTVSLWDLRNMDKRVCLLRGHADMVKSIEFIRPKGLIMTSAFDGNIHLWDINCFTGDAYLIYRRVLHIDGLMRTRVTRDGSKLIISTTDGYILAIHELDFNRITKDLFGFVPSNHLPRPGDTTATPPAEDPFEYLFTSKRNRVEIIDDFPMDDEPSMVPSLEWTCVHDIQCTAEEIAKYSKNTRRRRGASATRRPRGRGRGRGGGRGRGLPQDGAAGPSSQQPLRQTERTEETITPSERISRLRRVRLVINRDVTNTETQEILSTEIPAGASLGNLAFNHVVPVTRGPNRLVYTPPQPALPWYYSVNMPESSAPRLLPASFENGTISSRGSLTASSTGSLLTGIGSTYGPQSLFRKRRRLSHYIAEPNVGRGYIKEIAFGVDGRIIASPFGYGVRLLSFDPDCSELCDRTTDFAVSPIQLHEVVTNICHGSVVVTTKFSPDSSLLVTGSLGGKIGFHRPRW